MTASPHVVSEVEVLVEVGPVLQQEAHEFRQSFLLPLSLEVLADHLVPLHHVLNTGGAVWLSG